MHRNDYSAIDVTILTATPNACLLAVITMLPILDGLGQREGPLPFCARQFYRGISPIIITIVHPLPKLLSDIFYPCDVILWPDIITHLTMSTALKYGQSGLSTAKHLADDSLAYSYSTHHWQMLTTTVEPTASKNYNSASFYTCYSVSAYR